jgi:hypothetical protein
MAEAFTPLNKTPLMVASGCFGDFGSIGGGVLPNENPRNHSNADYKKDDVT